MGDAIAHTAKAARTSAAGFTLIELLVVIAVLAVLSLGAVLSVGRNEVRSDMQRFRDLFALQQDLAIVGREMRGLKISPTGYQIMAWRVDEILGVPGWQTLGDLQDWRGRAALSVRGIIPVGAPEVVFMPGGEGNAFSVDFSSGGRCETDGWADLICG